MKLWQWNISGEDLSHIVYLLTIYAKAKKEEVSVKEIKEALRELDINL